MLHGVTNVCSAGTHHMRSLRCSETGVDRPTSDRDTTYSGTSNCGNAPLYKGPLAQLDGRAQDDEESSGASVGSARRLRQSRSQSAYKMEPSGGFEPPTSSLRKRRSTAELRGHGSRSRIRTCN